MNPYNRGFDPNNPYAYVPNPNTPPVRPIPNRPPHPSPCPDYAGYAGFISGQIYPNFPFNDSLVPSQLPLTQTVPETQPQEQLPLTQNVAGSSSGKNPPAKRSHRRKTAEEKALAAANRQPLKWTPQEELALTKAWISESEKEQGTSRHKNDFWDDINKVFHVLMEKDFYRANDSLSSKWTEINRAMNAFHPHYYHARNNPKSGETDTDSLSRSLQAYRLETGLEFKFLHCWEVAKNHSRWAFVPTASNSAKRSKTGSSRNRQTDPENVEAVNLDDDDFEEELSRPPGRDKSKKRAGKSTASGSGSGSTGAYSADLQDLNATMIQFNTIQEKMLEEKKNIREAFEKKLTMKERKLSIREQHEKREDLKFLAMNTDHMQGPELEMTLQMKRDIIEKYNLK